MKKFNLSGTLILCLLISGCTKTSETTEESSSSLSIDYEKMILENGLEVVFHQDHSDPVVAVALTFHVGSAREQPGKTGFAHLFEHLFFLESENLGKGGLDKMSSRIGGSGANGSTSRDRTNYFQTLPKDALEKMIWAEADKVGYFINTVTDDVLSKEKQVVKNEKRQSNDNRAYGHTNYVITKNLYPEAHPYSWEVIGTLEDLQNSTLEDVKGFHGKYYGPNNATLVIAGDFDIEQAKKWVIKYFEEIPKGAEVEKISPMPVTLSETKKLYYEDNFARLPALQMVWPTVELYHPDSYPLEILAELLTDGKNSPFYQVLVEKEQVTSNAAMYTYPSEIAGEMRLAVRAYPDVDLDTVQAAVSEAFAKFEKEGFAEADLERIKAGIETNYYEGLSSVLGKAFQLAQYNIFADDPGYINKDIQKTLDVTAADVQRVYEKYIKGKPYVVTSFVPKGAPDLALNGSVAAEVIEEEIVAEGEGESFELAGESGYERTPSSFDRTQEPPYGESLNMSIPEVWNTSLDNGLKVYGIESNELPLVEFTLNIKGGMMLEDPEKTGVANLLAEMMTKGTATKTPLELEQAIDALGASIYVYSGTTGITLSGTTLSRNYAQTMALVEEILLQPRWDSTEFVLARQDVLSSIEQNKSNPNALADNVFRKVVYGDHILANDPSGTRKSVESISMADLKDYYQKFILPNISSMHVVGSLNKDVILAELDGIASGWKKGAIEFPADKSAYQPESSKIYFYDVPEAKQSVLYFGYLAMPETHQDYWPATLMNYKLGGGGFASRLTQELREGKGYTYGIRSGFTGGEFAGPFSIGSGVRTNVTYESAALIKDILENYGETFTDEDLEDTRSYFLKSNARAFETPGAKLNMLEKLSAYGWSADYLKEQENTVKNITREEIASLAGKYADPNHMIYVVVGDAETQLENLKNLGFGDPILIRDLESIPMQEPSL
jgi:zinc protease